MKAPSPAAMRATERICRRKQKVSEKLCCSGSLHVWLSADLSPGDHDVCPRERGGLLTWMGVLEAWTVMSDEGEEKADMLIESGGGC